MNGSPIQQADHAKYLGVTIDKNLNWNEHTRQIVSKANKVRGFLLHSLKKCPPDVKTSVLFDACSSIFGILYPCVAWSPYHQCSIQAIEMVQRHAARFALNKFGRYANVTEMINILGWPTLKSKCNTMKCINLVDVPTDTILLPSSIQLRGHSEKIQQLPCRVDAYGYCFFHKELNYGTLCPSI